MSLLSMAAELEKKLKKMIRGFIGGETGPHHLEIRQSILDEVEGKIQPIGGGVSVFPYNRLSVTLYVQDDDRRYFFESAFLEGGKLKNDIRERLSQSGCKLPQHLDIDIKFTDQPDPAWEEKGFNIEYGKHSASGQRPAARLVVIKGEAPQESYPLNKSNFNIGRLQEVRDKRDHIVRRNDLAFTEGEDEISQSISRAHAHIFFDEKDGCFRLCDDNSAQGTHIFRDGRNIEVPRNSPRGVKMHDSDEIYFGKAYLRFEIGPPEQTSEPEQHIASASQPAAQSVSGPEAPEISSDENALPAESDPSNQATIRDQPISTGEAMPVSADEPTPEQNAVEPDSTNPTENEAG